MKYSLLFAFSLILLIRSYGQQSSNIINASITFEIVNAGITVDGSLDLKDATIQFNEENLKKSLIQATADPGTIKTGIGIRDKHLKNEDYFDVSNFPLIKMTSKKLRKTGEQGFEGTFELVIKSVSKEIAMPFSYLNDGQNQKLTGQFHINRRDFGLGEDSILLSDDVKVIVALVYE